MATVWRNARIATMAGDEYGLMETGAVVTEGDRIEWVGPECDLPAEYRTAEPLDCRGRLLTPGLVDCHTHLVYGGDRADEFEQRLEGVSYAEIARRGGGIMATVRATREAAGDTLLADARRRLQGLLAEGVTTVEIKSGYGLDTATELKMLRVVRELGRELPVAVRTTFLGAHALPPEYGGRADDYIGLICDEMLPAAAAAGLADAVDAFCENIAFSPAQVERVFQRARQLGLPVKLHAEQLSNQGGAALAARYGALSADHLEYLDEAGVTAMAAADTVAVLLPGAFYILRETRVPPLAELRRQGVPIALATDLNPGSSPVNSLLCVLNLACTLFRLTPLEALAGVTRYGARALGLTDRGMLAPGRRADLVLWDVARPAELAYWLGRNPCAAVVQGGVLVRGTL